MPLAPNGVGIEQALGEVERELAVRVKCFPRWISEGRMSKMDANDRLPRLEAAQYFLQYVLDNGLASVAT